MKSFADSLAEFGPPGTDPDEQSQEETIAAEAADLSRPHRDFPGWDKATLYDVVTRMYLDSWNDKEVAIALSLQYGLRVGAAQAHSIRREAAMAAAAQESHDVKRKWIYRYRNLTLNNLVKEYMFMEGKNDFLKARRELSAEIDMMVKTTPTDRLLIAVNDALGRNNITQKLVHELLVYHKMAIRIEKLVEPFAQNRNINVGDALCELASKIDEFAKGDPDRSLVYAAKILRVTEKRLTEDDIVFLRDYSRFASGDGNQKQGMMFHIMHGADMMATRKATPFERLLSKTQTEFTAGEIEQMIERMKNIPVPAPDQIIKFHTLAKTRIAELEESTELVSPDGRSDPVRHRELQAYQTLEQLARGHLSLTDYRQFFTSREIDKAIRHGVPEMELQNTIGTLNRIKDFDGVLRQIRRMSDTQNQLGFAFPADRYCHRRFGLARLSTILTHVSFE